MPTVPVASARVSGRPGRGRAVLAALAAARHVGARAAGLVDAGLASITAEWVEPLLGPALNGDADYVSPSYTRALTEGTLTTNLLAPLARSLFGKRLQEVLGGCAARLVGAPRCLAAGGGVGRRADGPGRGVAGPRPGIGG